MGWLGARLAYQLGIGALLLSIRLGLRLQPPPFRIRTGVQHSRLRFHLSDLALLANRNRLRSARVHHRSELL
eukprot:COSAG04_NODE_932_length_9350_cov_665.689007_8_plen_72_part_00